MLVITAAILPTRTENFLSLYGPYGSEHGDTSRDARAIKHRRQL